jgi:hypothetical protein
MLEILAKTINIGVCDKDTLFIFQIARLIITIIQFAAPFALIIWGSLDFFKALIAGDEKEMKAKRKPFVQRLVAAVIILILPWIVNLVITTFTSNNDFKTCWKKASNFRNITLPQNDTDL